MNEAIGHPNSWGPPMISKWRTVWIINIWFYVDRLNLRNDFCFVLYRHEVKWMCLVMFCWHFSYFITAILSLLLLLDAAITITHLIVFIILLLPVRPMFGTASGTLSRWCWRRMTDVPIACVHQPSSQSCQECITELLENRDKNYI